MIKAQTSIMKTIMCSMLMGLGLLIIFIAIYIIGLMLDYFNKDGSEYLITLFFFLVLFGPLLNEISDILVQKRKYFVIDNETFTVSSKSLFNTESDSFPLKQNISINIRFDGIICYEWIELYAFSKKILIEKSELKNEDYNKIKDALLTKYN